MDRARADYMGMLGTVMNCLALQDFLEKPASRPACRPRSRWARSPSRTSRAGPMRHLEKGRVVIFGAGAGMPYFSTDTVAAQRALEIGAEACSWARRRGRGLRRRPAKNPDAVKFDQLAYDEVLARGLKVADATAISLARTTRCRSSSST